MCAVIKNPLDRDGTSQQQRLAKALLPENAKIDDRKIEEIIAFAVEYSRLINYYNTGNTIDGDWTCFYDTDPCILLALLATIDTDRIEAQFKELEEKIRRCTDTGCAPDGNTDEPDPLPEYYDDLINLIYSVALRIRQACKKLPAGNLFKTEIAAIIESDLHQAIIDNIQQDALVKLIGYDKASLQPGNDYSPFMQAEKDSTCECAKAWQLDREGYDCIFPDKSFDAASLKSLFYLFFVALLRIRQQARAYFEECIEKSDSHQPHVTLFLTFLYLFREAIDHLNTLTGTHLLYYFERILCLHKRAETPDKVHIIFELAKNFDTHLVEEGVLLNAGKEDGKQMVYALLEEVVVNKAKVEQIKTVYVNETMGGIQAAPAADTKDGLGEPFGKDEQAYWKPLGGPESPLVNEADHSSLEAGFALASPMFFLKEGLRAGLISYRLKEDTDIEMIRQADSFRLLYSSGKDWIEIENLYDAVERILVGYPSLQQLYRENLDEIRGLIDKGFDLLKELYEKLYPESELPKEMAAKAKAAAPAFDTDNVKQFFGQAGIDALSKSLLGIAGAKTKKGAAAKKEGGNNTAIDEAALRKELDQARNDVLNIGQVYLNRSDVNRRELDFFFIANTTAPAFTTPEPDPKKPGLKADWPVIKTLVRNTTDADGNRSSSYNAIRSLKLKGVDMKVAAYGVKNLVVQNDTSILDNSKEIQPFTNKPYPGSYFYIGSKEVFQKKLDFVGVQLDWAGRPDDFSTHYANYITTGITDDSFRVNTELLNGGIYQDVYQANGQKLFNASLFDKTFVILGAVKEAPDDDNSNSVGDNQPAGVKVSTGNFTTVPKGIDAGSIASGFELRSFRRDPYLPDFTDYNVNVRRGFLRLSLAPQDFLHDEYPRSLLKLALTKEQAGGDVSKIVKEPYTPKLKSTSLAYLSTERTRFGAGQYNATIDQFYHITPFGYQKMGTDALSEVYLLPQFTNAAAVVFTQGNLYIGLKDAKPEQKVNILFQVLDGSGDNRYAPPDIEWDYLTGNDWVSFRPFEIQDHTRTEQSPGKSLLSSGIIEFTLPKTISSAGTTILDPSLLWIRACAQEDFLPADAALTQSTRRIAALPDLVAIIAQAGIAQFMNKDNTLSHLAAPLPAKTISKFVDSQAAIKTVAQPYNSFDGRLPDNDNQFYRRISERLRHKNRAICIWDYERLVLEKYPSLYKVKCLNHTNILESKEIIPGFVSIAVIPDLRNRNTAGKTEPRVPVGMLDEIKAFLAKKTNLFVASLRPGLPGYLQVVNPLYEQVKVSCRVRFYEGYDPAYYKYVLNGDLKNFLAPWTANANAEISFGSAYHQSAILNFIEKRAYVDVVLQFSVQHYKDGIVQPGDGSGWIIPV
ncbi:MAG: hypothetical protein ABW019_18025, partial [Chitinophagaceae bacterium]